jgi:arylsulfatase A-like enzyme
VDAEVGNIFAFLKNSRRLENTIVVITADHGEALGEHGAVGHNSTVYDEMIRTPLIIYYPKKLKAGLNKNLAQTVDILPTICELAGLPIPAESQGSSLLKGSRKWAFSRTNGHTPMYSIRTLSEKLIVDSRNPGTAELYDLIRDPQEKEPVRRNRVGGPQAASFHDLETTFARWLHICLSNRADAEAPVKLDPALLARLKSLGYIQ